MPKCGMVASATAEIQLDLAWTVGKRTGGVHVEVSNSHRPPWQPRAVLASESVECWQCLSDFDICKLLNTVRVAACSHRRGARLRQVAHEALVLPRRRDSARQARARAPRPLRLSAPAAPRRGAAAGCRASAAAGAAYSRVQHLARSARTVTPCVRKFACWSYTIMTRVCSYCFSQPCKSPSPATSHPRNELV